METQFITKLCEEKTSIKSFFRFSVLWTNYQIYEDFFNKVYFKTLIVFHFISRQRTDQYIKIF